MSFSQRSIATRLTLLGHSAAVRADFTTSKATPLRILHAVGFLSYMAFSFSSEAYLALNFHGGKLMWYRLVLIERFLGYLDEIAAHRS